MSKLKDSLNDVFFLIVSFLISFLVVSGFLKFIDFYEFVINDENYVIVFIWLIMILSYFVNNFIEYLRIKEIKQKLPCISSIKHFILGFAFYTFFVFIFYLLTNERSISIAMELYLTTVLIIEFFRGLHEQNKNLK